MSEKSIVIVGGGIAGLSAGCYARMNGYRATVLEMHRVPGGLCAAWKRKGYTFDISMHMVVGSRGGPFHRMWRELGAVQQRTFHYHDAWATVESGNKRVSFGTDAKALERQMLALSPGDRARIRTLVKLIYGQSLVGLASIEAPELERPADKARQLVKLLPVLPTLMRHGSKTIQSFAEEFADPFLRRAVRCVVDSPGWPMLRFPLVALAGFGDDGAMASGVPLGGSQGVITAIAERFRALGGELRLKTQVADVIVESDRAAGVRLEDGSEVRADTVIWAADGHRLIFDLLGGRYLDDPIRTMYERWIPVRPLVHVALGIAKDLSREPPRLTFELPEPFDVGGETRRWITVIHHGHDPGTAPAGKTAVEVWYPTDYEYWRELATRRDAYEAEKKRIAELTIAALDLRFPGLAAAVEVVDVPTPATYVRYTGNWQGSPDGWYVTPENARATPIRSLPGLSDLFLAGQWTAPFTGTVIAAVTGRQVVQILCHRDGVPFQTTEP